jgi:DNA primase
VVLKPHGKDLIGLCPFHDDHEPSLVITPSKNLWHCMGACRVGGSVIDWVIKAEGVSFRHAVELLRGDLSSLAASSPWMKRSLVGRLSPVCTMDTEDREVLRQVVDYYHATLKESPEALRYLEKRGLMPVPDSDRGSSGMIDRFKLGFSNRTLGYRLPPKRNKSGVEVRSRLQRLGILRESGHEHFNGSLVIPIFDEEGRVAEIYGRKVRDDLREGTPLHLYLPGPHRGVWNIEAFQAAKEIILCEALIDALTFWCAGFRNVTASYGIEGFTADHLAAFRKYGTERVLIAYDRDDPGERAAGDLAARLLAEGIGCRRIHFPRGMDANDYARKVRPAGKSLGLLIQNAIWLGRGSPTGEKSADERMIVEATADKAAGEGNIEAAAAPPVTADVPAEVKAEEVMIREITHFVLHKGRCPCCGKQNKASLPREYRMGYGPRLSATIAQMAGGQGSRDFRFALTGSSPQDSPLQAMP